MNTSRALTIVGRYRWRFDSRDHTWRVLGRPEVALRSVVLKVRGGRKRAAWRLEYPGYAETFEEYTDAMIALAQYGDRLTRRSA